MQAEREDAEAERRGRSDSIRGCARAGNWGLLDPEKRDSQESLLPWPLGRGGGGQRRGGCAQMEPDVAHVMWAVVGMGTVGGRAYNCRQKELVISWEETGEKDR